MGRCLLLFTLLAALILECEAYQNRHHSPRQHHTRHHHRHRHHHRNKGIPIIDDEEQVTSQSHRVWNRDKRQFFDDIYGSDPWGRATENEIERGPWGDWSGPSSCSRSCGGGVTYQTRSCQGSSDQCVGQTKKYKSCNIEPCPGGSKDYRTEQCQRYNSVAFDGKYYSWVPYLDAPNKCELNCEPEPEDQSWIPHLKAAKKCELNCRPEGERFYYRHANKVVDGTKCDSEGFDICVDGECMPVGCDLVLGSRAQEDKCRICNGDGSTCNTVTGDFRQRTLTVGYNDIVLIPAGATNIFVEELEASNNYLAVRNMTGHFYLNGNWRVDIPRPQNFAGTTFHYERKVQGIFAPEILRALGPTTEPLFIVLLYQEANKGIAYEYSVPKEVTQPDAETYDWLYGTYGECSVECGGGHATRNVTCVRTSDFEAVDSYLCDPRRKPESNTTCNDHPCPASWQMGDWSPCTSSCGTPGWQFRHVYCGQTFAEGRLSVVDEYVCHTELGPPPPTVQECNRDSTCASWHIGDWSPCNKLCGIGRQHRKITCHVMEDGAVRVLADEACSEEKPETEKACERIPCTGVDWVTSDWTGCSNGCGLTNESRSVLCVSQKGKVVDEDYCPASRRPDTSRNCTEALECEYRWYASEWSACSADCGEGIQTRQVLCGVWESGQVTAVDEVNCDEDKRYPESQVCNGTKDCDGKWFAGPWSKCDKECGGGTKHRKIFCYVGTKLATAVQCDGNIIPYSIDSCNNHQCDTDEILGGDVDEEGDDECDYEDDEEEDATTLDMMETTMKEIEEELSTPDVSSENSSSSEQREKRSVRNKFAQNYRTETRRKWLLQELTHTEEDSNTTTVDGLDTTIVDDLDTTIVDDLDSNTTTVDDMSTTVTDELDSDNTTDDGITPTDLGMTQSDAAFEEGSGWSSTGIGSGVFSTTPGEETTPEEGSDKKKKKKRKCKKKPPPKKDCSETEFGCCLDNETPANGPFQKGCPRIETCKDTPHGCCPDQVTPASGPEWKGCPGEGVCENSLFGCCEDGITEAKGPDGEGCEDLIAYNCNITEFGCCPDGVSAASGENFAGCEELECEGSGPCETCKDSAHGCCPDGFTAAKGDNFEGCPNAIETTTTVIELLTTTARPTTPPHPDCTYSSYGCCPDGYTAAHGPNKEGCCLASVFGCCPDHVTEAQGPNLQGCGCEFSAYGCCPDNKTIARGPNNAGCGCQFTEFGCCPDNHTPAAGENQGGCACNTFTHGCCPDGITVAGGPNREGCGCSYEPFGCCADERTPAVGPNGEGCGCEASQYGCCPDGVTPADGKLFEGCQDDSLPVVVPGEVCGLEKDRGSCTNFTVMWFFDMGYGGCTRFWYGGCGGNLNRFAEEEMCKAACVEPEGMEVCKLPQVKGPCNGDFPSWYHDPATSSCKPFTYGGCLGNNNRFESKEACEELCVTPMITDVCLLEKLPGPCRGNFERWYFDLTVGRCLPFAYGGCKGNGNNFLTDNECMQQCVRGRSKDLCTLPKSTGLCEETLPRWYYDYTEKRCMPFYYTGCDGNANRFVTRGECEGVCPGDFREPAEELCNSPKDPGTCSAHEERWYYDGGAGRCLTFVYGGCGGNNNNFVSLENCENYCGYRGVIPDEDFDIGSCFLERDQGTCNDYDEYYHYDSTDGVCKQFYYGGCDGNENRFKTSEECQSKCGDAIDVCELPLVVGPCNGSFRQYYYDSSNDQCYEFDYGGCLGNKNRFDSMHVCQQRCKKGTVITTHSPSYPDGTVPETPDTDLPEVCVQPMETGNCRAAIPQWYYDQTQGRCIGFSYGGCSGNANRFASVEQCERHCGRYRGQDVCNQRMSPGPCQEQLRKWYHDPYERTCKPFSYGGCDGNGNRFSTVKECEAECIYHDTILPGGIETGEANTMICETDVDAGPCTEGYKRWHFNKKHGKCMVFLYGGCGGNRNRFKKFNTCTEFCAAAIEKYKGLVSSTEGPEQITSPDIDEDVCRDAQLACQVLQCPYGEQRRVDESGCEQCSCYDPCYEVTCPNNTQCAIELVPSEINPGESDYQAVCRRVDKPGKCPQMSGQTYECEVECQNDAGCYGDNKCCYDGCGYNCVAPVRKDVEAGFTIPPLATTPEQVGEPARITEFDEEVSGEESDVLEMKCVAYGIPTPTITWYRGDYRIDTESGQSRFRVLPSGSLQVVSTERNDAGSYSCEASNGIGSPDRKTTQLIITDPNPREASVVPWNPPQPVTSLGNPTMIFCRAVGWPRPSVTWWRADKMIPVSSEKFSVSRDGSLRIKIVTLRSLGPYTCHAYNGQGRAKSQTVILRSFGPVANTLARDREFLQYLVDPPKPPQTSPRPDPTTRFPAYLPDQRPYWPSYASKEPGETTLAPTAVTPIEAIVPVQAVITLNTTQFPPESNIEIPCEVRGFPTPNVYWSKNGQLIDHSDKYQINNEEHKLVITNAQPDDSGSYTCGAENLFGKTNSTTQISIEGTYVHPLCTDNPFFANCRLIVRAQYCTNKYYARFCCRSCTLAGQLPSHGAHLSYSTSPGKK